MTSYSSCWLDLPVFGLIWLQMVHLDKYVMFLDFQFGRFHLDCICHAFSHTAGSCFLHLEHHSVCLSLLTTCFVLHIVL